MLIKMNEMNEMEMMNEMNESPKPLKPGLASARLITWIHSHTVPPWYQSGLRRIGSRHEKSKNNRANISDCASSK